MPTLISPMKFWKNFIPGRINKRGKIIISTVLLSLGFLGIGISDFFWRFWAIAILSCLTYFFSAWSLVDSLSGVGWFTILALPTFFTAGVGFFYFLLPAAWYTRIPVVILYGVGIYVLLLVGNIFSVASIRTIQLLRSAQAVGFLLTLTTSFFLYDTILSFRLPFWINFFIIVLVSFPLIIQALWSVNLEEKITLRLLIYTLALSLAQGEIATAFSFWPFSIAAYSLALTTSLYISLGLCQHYLAQRLFSRTINEYLGVGLAVLFVIFLTTYWG